MTRRAHANPSRWHAGSPAPPAQRCWWRWAASPLPRGRARRLPAVPPRPADPGRLRRTVATVHLRQRRPHLACIFRARRRADAPALLVYHGDDESLSDWARAGPALPRGHQQLCSTTAAMAPAAVTHGTPSGRGRAPGLPALPGGNRRAPRRYVLGYSLGTGVLLGLIDTLRPAPAGVVIAAGFSSARAAAWRPASCHPGWRRCCRILGQRSARARAGPAAVAGPQPQRRSDSLRAGGTAGARRHRPAPAAGPGRTGTQRRHRGRRGRHLLVADRGLAAQRRLPNRASGARRSSAGRHASAARIAG